jgi:SnoaL-like domain
MPWLPELFSAPVLERFEEKQQQTVVDVPYFDGLVSGDLGALIDSFAGEPELQHPLRGRIKGVRAFEAFVAETNEWFARRNVTVSEVERVVLEHRGFEEVILELDTDIGRIALPHAMVADHDPHGHLAELRIYFSKWPLTGRHASRAPLLQRDPDVHESDVVGEYQRALAAGDADAIVAAFDADGYAREPAGGEHVHRGHDDLRAFYERLFSAGGGIPLEHCTATDDGRACALEYNVVRWGEAELPPQAGMAVYLRGAGGKLAAARIYDDVDPPLTSST